MVFCIRLLIVLWCSAKTRKINLMVHYVLCLLRSEAEILFWIAQKVFSMYLGGNYRWVPLCISQFQQNVPNR